MKTVAFRVDGGEEIGVGHLMRSRALAQRFLRHHWKVLFLTRSQDLTIGLKSEQVTKLDPALKIDRNQYPTWLGASAVKDAQECLTAAGAVDLWVIDHYGIFNDWVQLMKRGTQGEVKFLWLDDLADRSLDADYLLNQNSWAHGRHYPNFSGSSFFGLDYLLLRDEFIQARPLRFPRQIGGDLKILVSFGGGKTWGHYRRVLEEVVSQSAFEVRMVIPPGNTEVMGLNESKNILILPWQSSMTEHYLWADVCIGAGGSSLYERATLGLPSLLTALADNQIPIVQDAVAKGYANSWNYPDENLMNCLVNPRTSWDEASLKCLQMTENWKLDEMIQMLGECTKRLPAAQT